MKIEKNLIFGSILPKRFSWMENRQGLQEKPVSLRGCHLTLLPTSPLGHRAMPLSSPFRRTQRDSRGSRTSRGGQNHWTAPGCSLRPSDGPPQAWPLAHLAAPPSSAQKAFSTRLSPVLQARAAWGLLCRFDVPVPGTQEAVDHYWLEKYCSVIIITCFDDTYEFNFDRWVFSRWSFVPATQGPF